MALSGSSILVLIQTAVGPPGTYVSVGAQTGVKFDRKTSSIDITDKTGADKKYLGGERSSTITLDHLYVPNDAALQAMKNAWTSNTLVVLERQESGIVLEYCSALITQISEDAKKAAASTVQVTLEESGGWIAGSAP